MKKYIIVVLAIIVFGLRLLNDLYNAYNNLNMNGNLELIKLLDLIASILLPFIVGYCIYKYFEIEKFFEIEKIEYKNYKEEKKSLNDRIDAIEKENKAIVEVNNRLFDNIKTNSENSLITTRILRDIIIPNYILNNQDEKDIFARHLLVNLFTIDVLRKYGIDETTLTYMQSHYINNAKNKLMKNLIIKYLNRNIYCGYFILFL